VRSAARAARWAGPPPLLVVATIAAFLLAPVLSDNDPPPAPHAVEMAAATTAREGPTLSRDESRPTPKVHKPAKPAIRPSTIGVVSFNEFDLLPVEQIGADARAITARPTVDIIGWQEALRSRPVFADLAHRGWETRQLPGHARELAVSWRRSEFALVSSTYRLVAHGVDHANGRYPFGNRYVQRVTLRQRDTGQLISVINTHLPQKIEDLDNPGHWLQTSNAARARFQLARMTRDWRAAPGRWVVGTGDFNFDARADARLHPRGGPRAVLGDVAVSSYGALGFAGTTPSHPPTGRYVDYVQAARDDLHTGHLHFVGQRIIGGLNSDHNAVLARLRLR
jgi:endonuclease/exonuclease/phosphatase family metal-dependent hydrolase